jgi:predicted NUDIX family phosphoesterase
MGKLDGSEQVFVVPSSAAREAGLAAEPGAALLSIGTEAPDSTRVKMPVVESVLAQGDFRPRTAALEADETLLQVIPYVVATHRDKVLVCRRAKGSGEARLLGKFIVGQGGHINPSDRLPEEAGMPRAMIVRAARRELVEEFGEGALAGRLAFRGVLYDGRVHLGVVFVWDVRDPAALKPSDEIEVIGWNTPEEIQSGSLLPDEDAFWEGWSAMLIPGLDWFVPS